MSAGGPPQGAPASGSCGRMAASSRSRWGWTRRQSFAPAINCRRMEYVVMATFDNGPVRHKRNDRRGPRVTVLQAKSRGDIVMKLPRRQFLHLAVGATALPAVSRIASAQTYPSRPVRVVVAAAAGGASDIVARLIGQWLSERLAGWLSSRSSARVKMRRMSGSSRAASALMAVEWTRLMTRLSWLCALSRPTRREAVALKSFRTPRPRSPLRRSDALHIVHGRGRCSNL
jgi:hypothetical protein